MHTSVCCVVLTWWVCVCARCVHLRQVEGGRDAICKQYLFDDFKKAFAFMTRVAEYADEVRRCVTCDYAATAHLVCPTRWITTRNGSTCTTAWR